MHPISSTLAAMVARTAAKARHSQQMRGDSHDFERAVYRALTELDRTRPRLVAFAPEEALKRVLARPDVRHHLGVREERQPAPARFALARPWRDAEWHRPERRADRQVSAMAAMRVLLIVAIGLVLVAPGLPGAGAADAAKPRLKDVTRTATIAESGATGLDSAGVAIAGGPFIFANVAEIRRIDQLTLTATIVDGDTGPGDPKENLLSLALDGIDTGIKLNGFRNSQTVTQTISGAPANAGQILAALQADGRLDATIIDAEPNGNGVTLPANIDTTLALKGQQKFKKR